MDCNQGRFFRFAALLVLAAACCSAAACGSSSSSGGSSSGGSSSVVSPPDTTSTTTTNTSTPTSTSTGSVVVANLIATPAIKAQLLAAGAKMHDLPVSDYTGLLKGLTYYAYDPSTKTHWAGASLLAKPNATQAQVGDQDDGAYLIYKQPSGAAWHAYPAGIPGSTHFTCAVTPPASVDLVWDWPAGTCHPPHS